jgi:hypothetical protein
MVLWPDVVIFLYLFLEDRFHWHVSPWISALILLVFVVVRHWYASSVAETIAESIRQEVRIALGERVS